MNNRNVFRISLGYFTPYKKDNINIVLKSLYFLCKLRQYERGQHSEVNILMADPSASILIEGYRVFSIVSLIVRSETVLNP